MTATQAMEQEITRRVISRRSRARALSVSGLWSAGARHWPDRLIQVLAVTAALVVAGSFLQELLWAGLAAATICALAAD